MPDLNECHAISQLQTLFQSPHGLGVEIHPGDCEAAYRIALLSILTKFGQ